MRTQCIALRSLLHPIPALMLGEVLDIASYRSLTVYNNQLSLLLVLTLRVTFQIYCFLVVQQESQATTVI